MKKKLIAAAVVAGLAAPMAAHADVTVFGIGQAELVNKDNGAGTKTTQFGEFGNSRFGIKWSEDLGGGMKAIGQFEYGPKNMFGIITDTSSTVSKDGAGIYGREQWVGLSGAFGAVKFGTIHQAYKYAGGVGYDAMVGTAVQARGNAGMLGSEFGQSGYLSNSIGYYGKFGMVKVDATYSPAETDDGGLLYKGSKGDLTLAVKVGFKGGEAGVAYAKDAAAVGTTGTEGPKNTKIFGKYSFGTSTILGQYEQHKTAAGGASDSKTIFLGYQLKMAGMNMLAVQLGQTKADAGANPKTNYQMVAFKHNMSKKTNVFAGYMNVKPDGGNTTKVLTVGLTEKF